jgi:hypothetical protein
MNGLPSTSPNLLATMRATASTDPPAGCGTIIRTVLVGHASAADVGAAANELQTANAKVISKAIRALAWNADFEPTFMVLRHRWSRAT